MKVLRQIFTSTVLIIALTQTVPAEEGIIHPGIMPPPPPPVNGVAQPGSTDSGTEYDSEDATIDLVMEMTLSVVKNLLVLF